MPEYRLPLASRFENVSADAFRADHPSGIVRGDEGDVSGHGDHGVCAIGVTLSHVTSGVGVYVRDDSLILPTAVGRESAVPDSAEAHSAIEAVRVEIVVVGDANDAYGHLDAAVRRPSGQEKGARLPAAMSTRSKLSHQVGVELEINDQLIGTRCAHAGVTINTLSSR